MAIDSIADGQRGHLNEIREDLMRRMFVAKSLEERQQFLVRITGVAFELAFRCAAHGHALRRNGYAADSRRRNGKLLVGILVGCDARDHPYRDDSRTG